MPADDKKNARSLIANIILETFKPMDMHYPVTVVKRHEELLAICEQLLKAGNQEWIIEIKQCQ